jgi:hypothetical protein
MTAMRGAILLWELFSLWMMAFPLTIMAGEGHWLSFWLIAYCWEIPVGIDFLCVCLTDKHLDELIKNRIKPQLEQR